MKPLVFDSYDPQKLGYIEKGKSQTNPDDAVHRKVMMGAILHSGQQPNTNRMKQHDGDVHTPDFSRMDYAQFFDYVDRVEGALQEQVTQKKAQAAKAAKEKADKALQEAKAAAIKEYQDSLTPKS